MADPVLEDPSPLKVSKVYLKETLDRLKRDPEDIDALFVFGAWLATKERYEEAVEVLHEITKREPNYPGVWFFKAVVYKRMGNDRMAQLCMERDSTLSSS